MCGGPIVESTVTNSRKAPSDGVLTFAEAAQQVQTKVLKHHTQPIIVKRDPGAVKIADLPLRPLDAAGTTLVQFCDVLLDQPEFDWGEVENL